MAQHSKPTARPAPATPAHATGFRSWNRGRQIYLAVGILACIAGVMIIAFSR
jgi:hypothetical protein